MLFQCTVLCCTVLYCIVLYCIDFCVQKMPHGPKIWESFRELGCSMLLGYFFCSYPNQRRVYPYGTVYFGWMMKRVSKRIHENPPPAISPDVVGVRHRQYSISFTPIGDRLCLKADRSWSKHKRPVAYRILPRVVLAMIRLFRVLNIMFSLH